MSLQFIIHRLGNLSNQSGYRSYINALDDVEGAQRRALCRVIGHSQSTAYGQRLGIHKTWDTKTFTQSIPLITYEEVEELINEQRTSQKPLISTRVLRYQPTSGSTSARKWIPYTKYFLQELQAAIAPWLADAYLHYPGLRRGSHYWSLSWLPDELRKSVTSTDDTSFLPILKRALQRQVMAVPDSVQRAETCDAAMFATICFLAASRDLSLISVWSPTFVLNMLEKLTVERSRVAAALALGQWPSYSDGLRGITCPTNPRSADLLRAWNGLQPETFFRELWPDLSVVSCWTTSASAAYIPSLSKLLPHSIIDGKGLWTTEGVVTIPFQGLFPLALNSHFFEFRCQSTKKILHPWRLERGQLVQPIISTSSGLLRYALNDELLVTDFLKNCPTFEFKGRIGGVDLVGEKIDNEAAAKIIRDLASRFTTSISVIIAVKSTVRPYYAIVSECEPGPMDFTSEMLANFAEERLLEFHHYRLARELNQLGSVRGVICRSVSKFLALLGRNRGMIEGDVKPEPLVQCESESAFELALKEAKQ